MRILVVEDDEQLNISLCYQLKKEHFEVDSCLDGEEALYYCQEGGYDLILLDRMLPVIDGVSLLRKLRKEGDNTPVILITALGAVQDRVTGLDGGADDYLVKPFAFEELMARIRSVTRRPRTFRPSESLSFGDIEYFPEEKSLRGGSAVCTLSRKEGALLEALLRVAGQTLSRQQLLIKVWGLESDVEEGNLDNYIHFLRRRLKQVESSIRITTVRGVGYKLEV